MPRVPGAPPGGAGRVRYAAHARENINAKTPQLINRLYEHAVGNLLARPEAVDKLIKLVREHDGSDGLLRKAVSDLLITLGMDNSQVKAAEILLKKSVPDVAQIEYRGEHTTTHVVALPSGVSADEWTKLVNRGKDPPQLKREPALIEHE